MTTYAQQNRFIKTGGRHNGEKFNFDSLALIQSSSTFSIKCLSSIFYHFNSSSGVFYHPCFHFFLTENSLIHQLDEEVASTLNFVN